MASITGQTGTGTKPGYKVTITRTKIGYRETKSFPTLKTAEAWAKKREKEVDAAIAEGRPVVKQRNEGLTLGDAIDKYTAESMKQIGKTKTQCLRTIRDEYDISRKVCDRITSQDIVAFARKLHDRKGLASASTVGNYLSHLQAVFAVANPMWGLPLNMQAMKDAMTVCRTMGLTAKSTARDRRPTLDELDTLLTHFQGISQRRPNSIPMVKIICFALFSTRRQEEIVTILWKDYEQKNKRVMVRNMKHPGQKVGNDQYCELPDPACAVVDSMPKLSDRIFPYSTDAISAAFTRACKFLEIEDLRFHDLRHEGTSRLFEMGRTIPQVALVTGHKSWSSLQRYSQMRSEGDTYTDWKWISEATKKPTVRLNKRK